MSSGTKGKLGIRSGSGIQVEMKSDGRQEEGAERWRKGNTDSTNLTCIETYILEVDGSRQ